MKYSYEKMEELFDELCDMFNSIDNKQDYLDATNMIDDYNERFNAIFDSVVDRVVKKGDTNIMGKKYIKEDDNTLCVVIEYVNSMDLLQKKENPKTEKSTYTVTKDEIEKNLIKMALTNMTAREDEYWYEEWEEYISMYKALGCDIEDLIKKF